MENIINFLKTFNFTEEDINNTLNIYNADYIIFLENKYFSDNLFNYKKNLLKYFYKYNIYYLKFSSKNTIINIINLINSNIIHINNLNNKKNIKQNFFSENIIEPNLLYKKIKFSNQQIFVLFNNFTLKKIEYKLRTFCQIAEKLGAEKIVIDYKSIKKSFKNFNVNLNWVYASLGYDSKVKKVNEENIQIIFEYPNNHIDINLNKYYIISTIISENEFLMTKDEFESDLEMKFLIDARCVNFMHKYNTNFNMKYINKIEEKIFLKAKGYGLNIGNFSLKDNYINISISIDFFQIQNNSDIIDGTNIHILREGFIYLSNIIKKDDKYDRLIQFMQSHLNAINKKWIYLNYDYEHIEYVNQTYNNIINLNFKENEIYDLYKKYFENNLTWHRFKKFRDLILNGSDDNIEKIYFISFQYHDIINNKKYMMSNISMYIDEIINNYIDNCKNEINIDNTSFFLNFDMEEKIIKVNDFNNESIVSILIDKRNSIKVILYNSFKKSFKFLNGLSNNIIDTEKLIIVIKNILNYYHNNEINNLQKEFNKKNIFINIKKNIFDNLINLICLEIIKSLSILDTSPHINNQSEPKTTIYTRIQKIFLKFVIKFLDYENNLDKIYTKLNINKNINIEPSLIINKLEELIPINNCYNNYNKYKVFYNWNDFLNIINYFN
jgi:hypothetical protein